MTAPQPNRQHRAVTYLRVGSPHLADDEAIRRQHDGCLRIAEKYGLTEIRVYADYGRPARIEQQLELQRLLNDLATLRDAAFVVVWDYARLGRSMAQLDEVIRRIHACDARVATMTGVEAAERYLHWGEQT